MDAMTERMRDSLETARTNFERALYDAGADGDIAEIARRFGVDLVDLRGRELSDPVRDEFPKPTDPEYADVDDAGQLSIGVAGEQRSLDGLAPPLRVEVVGGEYHGATFELGTA